MLRVFISADGRTDKLVSSSSLSVEPINYDNWIIIHSKFNIILSPKIALGTLLRMSGGPLLWEARI